ncbi:MAG: hypothetical protein C0511_16385 [Hyphomicrobium sp.]|nr:hypothetical protein [Hyphomicrobium sp.]
MLAILPSVPGSGRPPAPPSSIILPKPGAPPLNRGCCNWPLRKPSPATTRDQARGAWTPMARPTVRRHS